MVARSGKVDGAAAKQRSCLYRRGATAAGVQVRVHSVPNHLLHDPLPDYLTCDHRTVQATLAAAGFASEDELSYGQVSPHSPHAVTHSLHFDEVSV